jgi:uncharacterized protein YkuJ
LQPANEGKRRGEKEREEILEIKFWNKKKVYTFAVPKERVAGR